METAEAVSIIFYICVAFCGFPWYHARKRIKTGGNSMDYTKLQNGSDIRGVAMEGIEGQHVNLTD